MGSLRELAGIYTEDEIEEIEERLAEKYAQSKESLRNDAEQ